MRTKQRRPSATDLAIRNDIQHLRPKLEQVDLRFGDVVYGTDQRINYVYFPETAVVAMIDTLEDDSTVEVGIIGHEGMVGINGFLGSLVTPDKAIVQISGSAMRMKTSELRKELRFGSPLQRLLSRIPAVRRCANVHSPRHSRQLRNEGKRQIREQIIDCTSALPAARPVPAR